MHYKRELDAGRFWVSPLTISLTAPDQWAANPTFTIETGNVQPE